MAVGCRPLVVYFNANDTLARVEQNVRIARSVRESGRRFLTKASHQTKQGNSATRLTMPLHIHAMVGFLKADIVLVSNNRER